MKNQVMAFSFPVLFMLTGCGPQFKSDFSSDAADPNLQKTQVVKTTGRPTSIGRSQETVKEVNPAKSIAQGVTVQQTEVQNPRQLSILPGFQLALRPDRSPESAYDNFGYSISVSKSKKWLAVSAPSYSKSIIKIDYGYGLSSEGRIYLYELQKERGPVLTDVIEGTSRNSGQPVSSFDLDLGRRVAVDENQMVATARYKVVVFQRGPKLQWTRQDISAPEIEEFNGRTCQNFGENPHIDMRILGNTLVVYCGLESNSTFGAKGDDILIIYRKNKSGLFEMSQKISATSFGKNDNSRFVSMELDEKGLFIGSSNEGILHYAPAANGKLVLKQKITAYTNIEGWRDMIYPQSLAVSENRIVVGATNLGHTDALGDRKITGGFVSFVLKDGAFQEELQVPVRIYESAYMSQLGLRVAIEQDNIVLTGDVYGPNDRSNSFGLIHYRIKGDAAQIVSATQNVRFPWMTEMTKVLGLAQGKVFLGDTYRTSYQPSDSLSTEIFPSVQVLNLGQ